MKIVLVDESKLSNNDKNQIEELNREIFPENIENEKYQFNKKQNEPKRLLVKDGNLIVGHLLYVKRRVELDNSYLNLFYVGEVMVKKQFRNKGIGKMLMTNFIRIAKKSEVDAVILICEDEVETFYTNCGLERFQNLTVWLNDEMGKYRKANGRMMGVILKAAARRMELDRTEIKLGGSV